MYSGEKIDKVLEFYVRLAEETEQVFTHYTLNVNGLIITGSIIPASEYFHAHSHVYSEQMVK